MWQRRKLLVRASVAGAAALVALMVGFAGWRAKQALRLSTEEVQAEREIRFETHPFAPPVGVQSVYGATPLPSTWTNLW